MKPILESLSAVPKVWLAVLSAALVLAIGGLDYLTGFELSFSIFYLIPIMLVAWAGNRGAALVLAFLCALVWGIADIASGHTYASNLVPVWNGISRLGIFLLIVYFTAQSRSRMEALGRTDSLTGVADSRSFRAGLEAETARSFRYGRPFSLAYVDIDNFAKVNADLGRGAGDDLLHAAAQTIKDCVRSLDTVARLGGDEFAVLLPETDEDKARAAVEKIHAQLHAMASERRLPATFSFGVLTSYEHACTVDELIRIVMTAAQQDGKNTVRYEVLGLGA